MLKYMEDINPQNCKTMVVGTVLLLKLFIKKSRVILVSRLEKGRYSKKKKIAMYHNEYFDIITIGYYSLLRIVILI